MINHIFEIKLDLKDKSVGFNISLVILSRTEIMYSLKHETKQNCKVNKIKGWIKEKNITVIYSTFLTLILKILNI